MVEGHVSVRACGFESRPGHFTLTRVAKLVDAQSSGGCAFGRAGSSPVPGTEKLWRSQGFFLAAQASADSTHGFQCATPPFRPVRGLSLQCGYEQPHRCTARQLHHRSKEALSHQRSMQCRIGATSTGHRACIAAYRYSFISSRGLETTHTTQCI